MKNNTSDFLMKIGQLICLATLFINVTIAQELPKPNHQNTFYMLPLYEEIRSTTQTELDIRNELDKMITQLGQGNIYHQNGPSFIFPGYSVAERAIRLAKEKGMRVGIILGTQTHTNPGYFPILNQDIRSYQWRLNGIDWLFSQEQGTGDVLYPGELRDSGVYSPSRLCTLVRNRLMSQITLAASEVIRLNKEYPGLIGIKNGIIEQELATGGQNFDDFLGDYSPFAITEYRDWLRHKGIYDPITGAYKGEGAQAAIVGTYLNINGTLRSQFYDDPSPANANGTGVSFNTFFGTNFTTWTNKYYDLDAYPNPIPAPAIISSFDPTPESGNGFTAGGFDAPRVRVASNNFWKSWSWDVLDQGGAYPPGHPTNPAFGFRQQMQKNYIKDVFDAYANAGLTTEDMYPHQIPGEIITPGRLRSGADPTWTGHLALSNNTGITRFGYVAPSLLNQYASSWGIFEWHPSPNTLRTSQALYNTATTHLNDYYANGCHALFPGWWRYYKNADVFPLPDSRFADAIKDFMNLRKEHPYTRKDQALIDYTPPQVTGVEVLSIDATTHMVRWPQEIWAEYPETWRMWSRAGAFDIEQSTDNVSWTSAGSTQAFSRTLTNRVAGTNYFYRVRASTRALNAVTLKGNWSSITSVASQITLTPTFNAISPPNPNLVNNVSIKITDSQGNINGLNSYAAGGSFARTDANGTKFLESFTNNNQAEYPADVRMTLNGTVTRNTGEAITIKFTPPPGATIDALTFNYFCNYGNAITTLQVLNDADELIWENDVNGTTNGYKGIHFLSPSNSFTLSMKMKQTSTSSDGWFAQVSGIKVIYTVKPRKTEGFVSCTVTGVGTALNTVPNNFAQADVLIPIEKSSDISAVNNLTSTSFDNGVFSAVTSGTDPYCSFAMPKSINGTVNPHVYFRVYASQAIPNAQLFWFKTAFVNTTFALAKGWNVIQLSNLPEWINGTDISRLRLDFGGVSGISIKVDWIAASPQVYGGSLISQLEVNNGEAVMPTSSTEAVGVYRVLTNYEGVSNFVDINVTATPLPIKLVSYTATKETNGVKLEWITSSEINNHYFLIERSNNGVNYKQLTTENSKNSNSTALQKYVYTDLNPLTGINYYRLKQFDFDGKSEDLGVKAIHFAIENNEEMIVFPNPTMGDMSFKLSNYDGDKLTVFLSDLNGKVVFKEEIKASLLQQVYKINLPKNISNGNYFFNVKGDKLDVTKKIIYLNN